MISPRTQPINSPGSSDITEKAVKSANVVTSPSSLQIHWKPMTSLQRQPMNALETYDITKMVTDELIKMSDIIA